MTHNKIGILNFSNQDFWNFPISLLNQLQNDFQNCEFRIITNPLKLQESMKGIDTLITIPMNVPGIKRFKELKNIIILGSTIPLNMRDLKLNIVSAKGLNAKSVAAHANSLVEMALKSRGESLSLSSFTLGIVGTGFVAQEVKALSENLYPKINLLGRSVSANFQIEKIEERHKFAQESDIIIFCIDSNSQTQSYFDLEFLEECKNNVILVNVARGDLIDEKNICEDLKQSPNKRYYTDVTIPEDYPQDGALRSFSQVLITNHIGAKYNEAWYDLENFLIKNLKEICK